MLRNPNGLARALMILLAANIAFDIPRGVILLRDLSTDYQYGDGPDALAMAGADLATYVLSILVLLATMVVFIVWFHLVRRNAEVFAPDAHERSVGWAIGGWFVPIAWFWIPRGTAADIWRASRPDPSAADGPGELRILNFWWGFWVVSQITSRASGRLSSGADTLDDALTATWWTLAGVVLDVVAASFAILFVRRLTSMQDAKANGMIPAA
ncbi:DUF4328 domain-containing protein [Streptomyces laurentii]|uniref:DUF4328 domain-containing protein n=1 Tax=Streptomyces laurentii TaxID=39478 RepID=UPI00367F9696